MTVIGSARAVHETGFVAYPPGLRRELEGPGRQADLIGWNEGIAPRHGEAGVGEVGALGLEASERVVELDNGVNQRDVALEGDR